MGQAVGGARVGPARAACLGSGGAAVRGGDANSDRPGASCCQTASVQALACGSSVAVSRRCCPPSIRPATTVAASALAALATGAPVPTLELTGPAPLAGTGAAGARAAAM